MSDLQRVTTEYVESEDRLRLSGAAADGSTVVLWLTQRLALRLLPLLCGWLEQQTVAGAPMEVVQEFAQQAALAALEPSAPVQAAQEAQAWLVHTVDVNTSAELVRLDFKSEAAGPVRGRLVFAAQPLRQWLGILHDQCRRAGWPESAWPEWMQQAQAQPPAGQGARLH